MRRRAQQRGSAMIEFVFAGIGSVMVLISTFQLAMGMWNYHTLATMVHEATRYAAVRGVSCTKPGNTCSVTVGNIARKIESTGVGIPSNRVNVKFTTEGGEEISCAPLVSCFSNASVWPPASNFDNRRGKLITISVNYQFQSALLFWPGQGTQNFGTISLPASSTQSIIF